MISLDGAQKSGSGTIVRAGAALSALLGQPLHLYNIRARRQEPGLRPQHLHALMAVRDLCQGHLDGARVGASEVRFTPGPDLHGGAYRWDIGTAGSTTMLAMTVLPVALFAPEPSTFTITGGLFQDFAPSAFHFQQVFLPTLERMGVRARLELLRPGYVPRGGGVIRLSVEPVRGPLRPLVLPERRGRPRLWGVALSSHLKGRRVSERMAGRCREVLRRHGYDADFEVLYDDTAIQEGAALALFAETEDGSLLGADQAGAPRRPSEAIGEAVATMLLEDLATGATVDRHLADQVVLYAGLAGEESVIRVPRWTDHLETVCWLVEEVLGARTSREGDLLRVQGVGYGRS